MAYQAGQKVGNYQLEGFLGYGGFAEVYLGKHIYLETQAAIKVLHRQVNNEGLEKFLQEARIIAGLKHPHIVGVLEFGIEEQHPFLVMEYAQRGTLRKRYARGKALPPTTILPHVKHIAEALQYAHERKIIHRDVKPENMLLNTDNTILLSDFGLALLEQSTYHSIRSTDSAGTTLYMSPEQLRGKPCTASDQYALGVVMYEWLCGCLPFDGPDVSIIVQHLHEPPQPLRDHVPTLSVKVEAVVLKALEKDPKQRFASVQEMALAFEEACKDAPLAENSMGMNAAFSTGIMKPSQAYPSNIGIQSQLNPGESNVLALSNEMPGVQWPSHYSSLHGPSLSASLDLKAPGNDTVDLKAPVHSVVTNVLSSTTALQNKGRVSRRILIGGMVGMGALLGGFGVWRFSPRQVELLVKTVQEVQKSTGGTTATTTSHNQTTAGKGHGGASVQEGHTPSSPGNSSKGTGKGGTTSSTTPSKQAPTATATPTTAPSSNNGNGGNNNGNGSNGGNGNNPVATSTPDTSNNGGAPQATPAATTAPSNPPPVPLTSVQMSNVPSSVKNGSTVDIAITTNVGNASIQFTANYSGFGFLKRQPDVANGTTDGNGNATVSWTPSVVSGLFFARASATLQVTASDQNGNTASSPSVQVDIMR